MSLIRSTKAKGFPEIYGFANKFFSAVQPKLDRLLNRRIRTLTLSQTFGTAFHAFHPFLIDYPTIRRLLSKTNVDDLESCKKFWTSLEKKSIIEQFIAAKPKLEDLSQRILTRYPQSSYEGARLVCAMQDFAFESLAKRLPDHFHAKVFFSAFNCFDHSGRTNSVTEMQLFCRSLETELANEEMHLLDLYNLSIYKNGLAYHCYQSISKILNNGFEHAIGDIKIVVPNDQYIYKQWAEVTTWFSIYKKAHLVIHDLLPDVELNKYFVTVFCLRDLEIGKTAVDLKKRLLRLYLRSPKKAKEELLKTIGEYPFAAPYWVKQYLKLNA